MGTGGEQAGAAETPEILGDVAGTTTQDLEGMTAGGADVEAHLARPVSLGFTY